MKITIDTKEDSPEDIRRIIAMLSQLSGRKTETYQNILAEKEETPTPEPGFFNMFSQPTENKEEQKEEKTQLMTY